MIQKKVCMLGAFAVGKTSLVSRFVSSIFSEKYHTTLGVKVDKKRVKLLRGEMDLILWDLYGDDDFQKVRMSYLQGASAYLLVADGTRPATIDVAISLQRAAEAEIGKVPYVLAVNKVDLADQWRADGEALSEPVERGWKILRTSARSGEGVEEAFLVLARAMASR